ncbi:TRAP transporter small permease [Amphritea sp. 1_MG-2023]|uniref:TRAP transporter small permease subunit n=1 Tax=Amphritea sp. 1_MG-2023 TaxID=3062670 RepID=UPI0026E1CFD7|nr:TRAP transporter small permease [Amphritea sp. 1_MG-2023]MDO6564465.1 TRAP transporter small permease [Amphritea sp. 1_MG-2023]
MLKIVLTNICLCIDWLVRQAGRAAAFIMPVLALVVAFEVFSRYVLGQPTIWAFDLSLFMFGYLAALGGAYAQQQRAHINVDILYLKVSRHTRSVFNLISFSLAIFFLIIIVKVSFGKYEEAIEFDYRRQSEWAPPMFHFWIMMMIASGLFIAQLARDMLAELYFLTTGQMLIEAQNDGN